jgi:hypothetical protein
MQSLFFVVQHSIQPEESFLFYRLAKEDQEKNGKDIPQTGQGNCRAYHPKHIGFFGTHGI